MKKVLPALAIAAVLTLVLVSTALAQETTTTPTGIMTDSVAGGGYAEPTAGQSPHGGYSTTTNKCKVCHAVHGATGPEYLLRTTRAESCIYCHVSTMFSISHPYGTDPAFYRTEYENNHAATHQGTSYAGCPNCHSVHGTNVWSNAAEGITAAKILRDNPGGAMVGGQSTGAVAAPVTTLNGFCRDCHDKTSRADGTGTCNTCHDDTGMRVTDDPNHGGPSHIMTSTLTNAGGVQVAVAGTTSCRSCHSGGQSVDGNSFPHLTQGAAFLPDYHTSPSSGLDRTCLDCHLFDGGASGVGKTY